MAETVPDYRALLSGSTWSLDGTRAHPVFLTYSFDEGPYGAYRPEQEQSEVVRSFEPFSEAARATTREALRQWDEASGVRFLEVPAGQGDISFRRYDFSKGFAHQSASGYASFPMILSGSGYFEVRSSGGDVYINTARGDDPHIGLLLHEIGHALGLKHPFEGSVVLDKAVDTRDYTVMSYTPGSGASSTLGPLDVAAIQSLYGLNSGEAAWSWDAATHTLAQDYGTQDDQIVGISTANVIFGRGGLDLIYGRGRADRIDGGSNHDTLFGQGGDDRLDGGSGDDRLSGEAGADALDGGAGDDRLDGGEGADLAWGRTGNDWIKGGNGNDVLAGDEGNDSLDGGGGNDRMDGGADQDSLVGGDGNDALAGGAGLDRLDGGEGNDTLLGGDGGDALLGRAGADRLDAGAGDDALAGDLGDDVLLGRAGADRLDGGEGRDVLIGDAGSDRLFGRAGDDRLDGGADGDVLAGGDGLDRLDGGEGADVLTGEAGADTLLGRAGADRLDGGAGADTLAGGTEDDRLEGGADNDILAGEAGADTLFGRVGADRLDGGEGADILVGGEGADLFVFAATLGTSDRVVDFASGSDRIVLDDDVFTALKAGALPADRFFAGTAARDADDRLIFDAASGQLSYDPDGTGAQAQVTVAVLDKVKALSVSDFLVVA